MSHLLGDWTSLRLLLQQLAAAYTAATAAASGFASNADLEQPLPHQHQHGLSAATTAQADKQELQRQRPQQEQEQVQAGLVPAAPLLNQLVDAVHQQQQAAAAATGCPWLPVRLKPLEQADSDRFSKLAALSSSSSSSSSSQRPVRLSYYVPPGGFETSYDITSFQQILHKARSS
jgi:predicted PhzF superfamily epimerase YddE/YHI9